jgi:asparagine synthase (glutamine-hydrolysing)
MCGIAGIVSETPVDLDALRRMDRCIAHRGPDDHGVWSRSDGTVAFAHRRLSILDLSSAGHQPLVSSDGRFVITYNGEIYNFKALRDALVARGCQFRSQSDTEVILAGYAEHGAAFVERLRGMFAFAIWDDRERECIVARDRFGIKPFYYTTAGGRLAFGSSVRALVSSGLCGTEPDADAMQMYLRTGSVPEPFTLLRDIRALDAGCIGTWRAGRFETRRYWSMRFEPVSTTWGGAVAATRAALDDSVTHHLVSDVPVGVFLSGGIDSNALVALATRRAGERLNTFSIAFPGEPGDEGALARRSADHFGTSHVEWALDDQTGLQLFEDFLKVVDQPSIDGFNTFAVSKLARDRGLKVVLSGVGGDELFGGYKSFEQVPQLASMHQALSVVGLNRPAGQLAMAWNGAKGRRVGEWLSGSAGVARSYDMLRGIFTADEARRLTAHVLGGQVPLCEPLPDPPPGADADQISYLELSRYMRNQLLRDADVMSMAWGLELRVPFLDNALFETLSAIPARLRVQPGKRLLTAAVPELPEWIVNQPKRGFLFPIERWIGGQWRDVFVRLEHGVPVPLETWYRKWGMFMLDRWMHTMRTASND